MEDEDSCLPISSGETLCSRRRISENFCCTKCIIHHLIWLLFFFNCFIFVTLGEGSFFYLRNLGQCLMFCTVFLCDFFSLLFKLKVFVSLFANDLSATGCIPQVVGPFVFMCSEQPLTSCTTAAGNNTNVPKMWVEHKVESQMSMYRTVSSLKLHEELRKNRIPAEKYP